MALGKNNAMKGISVVVALATLLSGNFAQAQTKASASPAKPPSNATTRAGALDLLNKADTDPSQPFSVPATDPFAATKIARVQAAGSALTSRQRQDDLFGVPIRGDFKGGGVAATSAQPTTAAAAIPAGPTFGDAVTSLRVAGINLDSHEILVGRHRLYEGDIIVISLQGKRFSSWVESIAAGSIVFRDKDSGEVRVKSLRTGPPGAPGSDPTEQPQSLEEFLEASQKNRPESKQTPSPAPSPNL